MKYNDLYWIDLNIYLEFRFNAELWAENIERTREKKNKNNQNKWLPIDRLIASSVVRMPCAASRRRMISIFFL